MPIAGLGGVTRTKTAHQYVLKSLRDAILSGQLGGGTRLVQADLAEQLDVSITPVREALRDLVGEGLVIFDAHRGALVRALDVDEVRELYELRIVLEPMHVRRVFAQITDEQIDVADALRLRMEETEDIGDWAELNRQFHAALTAVDHESRLAKIIAGLRDSASLFVSLSLGASEDRVRESNEEHAQLVELYRKRDLAAVEALTVRHLQTTLTTIEEAHSEGLL
jgi:DNA-binding GntR family transcriptional regulator